MRVEIIDGKSFFIVCIISSVVCFKNALERRSRSIYQIFTDQFSPTNFSYIRCIEQLMSENLREIIMVKQYKRAIN